MNGVPGFRSWLNTSPISVSAAETTRVPAIDQRAGRADLRRRLARRGQASIRREEQLVERLGVEQQRRDRVEVRHHERSLPQLVGALGHQFGHVVDVA